jgi:hypothetical protein
MDKAGGVLVNALPLRFGLTRFGLEGNFTNRMGGCPCEKTAAFGQIHQAPQRPALGLLPKG